MVSTAGGDPHRVANPQPQAMFKVFFPAKYNTQVILAVGQEESKYLTISYLSPCIQVIVCLRWVHFGQKESSLKEKKTKVKSGINVSVLGKSFNIPMVKLESLYCTGTHFFSLSPIASSPFTRVPET